MAERRLQIAFVVDRFGSRFGGAEAYGVELMRELAKRHDITVFAREYDPDCNLDLPFVSLRSWKRWPSWVRVLIFAIKARRLTRTGFDIVHSHMNGWCGHIEVVHVTPVRYRWRVRPLPRLKRLLSHISLRVQTYLQLEARRVAVRAGHRTVAVSALIAQQLKQAYPHLGQIPVIAPGVDAMSRPDAVRRASTRHILNYENDDFVCLLVARNPLRKGLSTVLKALSGLHPQIKLLVVGGNAAAHQYVERYESGQLQSRVQILGETPHVAQYYEAADAYVHPTLNDSFGMAPLEAMSFGLPVILSPPPWCGFAQYVNNKTEALVLDHPEDATQLASCIQQLRSDPALRQKLQQGGAEIVARHSWQNVAKQYEELFVEILADHT